LYNFHRPENNNYKQTINPYITTGCKKPERLFLSLSLEMPCLTHEEDNRKKAIFVI